MCVVGVVKIFLFDVFGMIEVVVDILDGCYFFY